MNYFLVRKVQPFVWKCNRNALKNEYMCVSVFYVTHDINMKLAGKVAIVVWYSFVAKKSNNCRSAKMAMYSPHTSVFLRRDWGYDLGSINNLFGKKTKSNGSVRLYSIRLIIKLTNNSMSNFIFCQNQSKSILFSFVRLDTLGKCKEYIN